MRQQDPSQSIASSSIAEKYLGKSQTKARFPPQPTLSNSRLNMRPLSVTQLKGYDPLPKPTRYNQEPQVEQNSTKSLLERLNALSRRAEESQSSKILSKYS